MLIKLKKNKISISSAEAEINNWKLKAQEYLDFRTAIPFKPNTIKGIKI